MTSEQESQPPRIDGSVEIDGEGGQAHLRPRVPLRRWLICAFALLSLGMIPWTVYVYASLPTRYRAQNFDLAWAGFDIGLAVVLAATAWALYSRATWTQAAAVATATFLIIDAWFDISMSHAGQDRNLALFSAAFAELPLAAVCLLITARIVGGEERIEHIAGDAVRRPRRALWGWWRTQPPTPQDHEGGGGV